MQMKFATFFILFLSCSFIIFCNAEETEINEENDVIILTDNNFDEVINKYQFVLVKFYAPWCGHCKKLAPEFEKAATAIKEKYHGQVALGHADTTVEKKLGSRYEITGYPTLKFFITGEVVDYTGDRTEDTIVQWIDDIINKDQTIINSEEDLDIFKKQNSVAVVYFGNDESEEEFLYFKNVNKIYDEFAFAYTFNEELKAKFEITTNFGILLFKEWDEKFNIYSEKILNSTLLQNFLYEHSLPKVAEYNKIVKTRLTQKKQKALVIFYEDSNSAVATAIEALNKVQHDLGDKLLLVTCSIPDSQCKELASELGIESLKQPSARIVVPKEYRGGYEQYFIEEQPELLTDNILLQFYEDYKDEKLEASLKTEELPESQNSSVIKVVGRTFSSIVGDKTKDVIVFFYTSTDDEKYKSVNKAFKAAAEQCTHMENLVFASIDMNKNQVEHQYFREFPVIRFFTQTRKQGPMNFNKEYKKLETEQIIDYLREKASIEWLEPAIFGNANEPQTTIEDCSSDEDQEQYEETQQQKKDNKKEEL